MHKNNNIILNKMSSVFILILLIIIKGYQEMLKCESVVKKVNGVCAL